MDREIQIRRDHKVLTVMLNNYVTVKTKGLQEFGYESLTEAEVLESVERLLNGGKCVTVIDSFIKDDLV